MTPPETVTESFPYGWRYVSCQTNGTIQQERIALTLEDALHPQFGDILPETNLHGRIQHYLSDVLEAHFAHDPTVLVLNDVLITRDQVNLRPHAPDVAVIFGVQAHHEEWKHFDVVEQGVRPVLMIEITSERTRSNDIPPQGKSVDTPTKFMQYAQAQVAWYVLIDNARRQEQTAPPLAVYQRSPAGLYVAAALDATSRRFFIEPVGLWLGVSGMTIAWFDPQDQPIGDYTTIKATLAETAT